MGYQLDHIQNFVHGELYKISGLIDSKERIAPEINDTNLKDSLILFSEHISKYTKPEKRLTAVIVDGLLRKYYKE